MIAASSDRYSRLVAWLKVLLPLAALGLLSTLFLLSRAIDPEQAIPFADKEIKDRLRNQQVTGPFFSGTTVDGDQISFTAETLTTPEGQTGSNEALGVSVDMDLSGGGDITLLADRASFDITADLAELSGNVRIRTSTGYTLTSDMLRAELSALNFTSPGPVTGKAPSGTLSAGGLTLNKPGGGDSALLIFTNGVKLVYTPKQQSE